MDNINPIDMALAVILASIDSLLWVINELLGLHVTETALEEPTAALSPSSGPIPGDYAKKLLQAIYGPSPLSGISNPTGRHHQLCEQTQQAGPRQG